MPFSGGVGGGVTQYAIQAYLTSDQSVPASLTYTVLQLASEDIDTDNWFDTSTYRFTPLLAGNWFFTASALFTVSGAGVTFGGILRIRKNGSQYAAARGNVVTGTLGIGCSIFLPCFIPMNGTTDFIDVQVAQNQLVTATVQGGNAPRLTWLTGALYS